MRVFFERAERRQLVMFFAAIGALHVLGWALFLGYGSRLGPAYAGAGSLAYVFGLRHGFDADHIAAVDDTTRYLMQQGKRPLGTGFFFSLGHSTVVLVLALSLAFSARSVQQAIPGFQQVGATVGASISATFLVLIAILDLVVLRGILDVWRKAKRGAYAPEQLNELMAQRGFLNRVLGQRWRGLIRDSRQMYPVGLLFGLGFDTASEIGLLALTAAAATGTVHPGTHGLPVGAIVALPLLFAAGMTLIDTTDGIVMVKAYDWAFRNPIRKVYYNLATVGLGIFVAGLVATVEYLQVLSTHAGWNGGFWSWLHALDFQVLGYVIVATFVTVWVGAMLFYKVRRLDERYGEAAPAEPS